MTTPHGSWARALRDRGDPHGELIELQCALARCADDDVGARHELVTRIAALFDAHGDAWLGMAGLRRHGSVWARSFIDKVILTPARLAEVGQQLARVAPVSGLKLCELDGDAAALARALADPLLGVVTALDLQDNALGPDAARALAGATHLTGLTRLDLFDSPLGSDGVSTLVGAPHFASLQTLRLSCRQEAEEPRPPVDVGACAIAAASHLTGSRRSSCSSARSALRGRRHSRERRTSRGYASYGSPATPSASAARTRSPPACHSSPCLTSGATRSGSRARARSPPS